MHTVLSRIAVSGVRFDSHSTKGPNWQDAKPFPRGQPLWFRIFSPIGKAEARPFIWRVPLRRGFGRRSRRGLVRICATTGVSAFQTATRLESGLVIFPENQCGTLVGS